MTTEHTFNITEEDETTCTWMCTCGFWCTVETKNAPDYHTPMAQRFAEHLAEVEAIETGRAWLDLPAGYYYRIFHRKSWIDGQPGQIVVWAVWAGGFRELATWPCTGGGMTWRNESRRTTYMRSFTGRWEPVTAEEIMQRTRNWS